MKEQNMIHVDTYTNGILDPKSEMLGPISSEGYIVAKTAPGCWGPMSTPEIKGTHEVTTPVFVKNAQIGDSIAIKIKSIRVDSSATLSGVHETIEGRYLEDPGVMAKCETCNQIWPKSRLEGIGNCSFKCSNCGGNVNPFLVENGYTMVFDIENNMGITVDKKTSEIIAHQGYKQMDIPKNSIQNPAVTFASHDLVGIVSEMYPFLGQLGTLPPIEIPDSRNAGDFGTALLNKSHRYNLTEEQLEMRTDSHMDISRVREGAILICPVKVKGGGIYLGDMHAMQGDGEIAGHTTDVSGLATMQVSIIKNLKLEGPILLPTKKDLPYLARPLTQDKREKAKIFANIQNIKYIEDSYPLSFIGTGSDLNRATSNALERASNLLDMSINEVKNRCTINGSIEIGRHPGVVTATFKIPEQKLETLGILSLVKKQYNTSSS